MKTIKTLLILCVIVLSIGQIHAQNKPKQDKDKLLRRTLIFVYKTGTPLDSIQAVDNTCIKLSKLPVVKEFEWGNVVSYFEPGIDDAKKARTRHVYIFSFAKEDDIPIYEKSPEHGTLVELAMPILESFQVIDRWSK